MIRGGLRLFAVFSFLVIASSFYLTGAMIQRLINTRIYKTETTRANPVALSIPVFYLFFLVSLNIQTTLMVLISSMIVAMIILFKKIDHSALMKFFLVSLVLYFVICQHPLLGWDTRSIWFFHAKIFHFFSGNEMMAHLSRSEIASFSHSDYPKLHPFLAALFASPYVEWKEQVAKGALVLLWTPVFSEIFRLINIKIKILALFFVLMLSNGQIIAGMTDWLLACYVLIAFLIYHESKDRWMDSLIYLSLPILIKAEGLVLTVLGTSIILILKSGFSFKGLLKSALNASTFFIVPGLAFLLWKFHCSQYAIHNYLTNDPSAALQRLVGRLSDGGKSLGIFVDAFGYYNKLIKNMVYVALIRRVFIWQKITRFEMAVVAFAGLYSCFLFLTYMATPFDLDWHLSTSVERTAFPIYLLLLVGLLIRDINASSRDSLTCQTKAISQD